VFYDISDADKMVERTIRLDQEDTRLMCKPSEPFAYVSQKSTQSTESFGVKMCRLNILKEKLGKYNHPVIQHIASGLDLYACGDDHRICELDLAKYFNAWVFSQFSFV